MNDSTSNARKREIATIHELRTALAIAVGHVQSLRERYLNQRPPLNPDAQLELVERALIRMVVAMRALDPIP